MSDESRGQGTTDIPGNPWGGSEYLPSSTPTSRDVAERILSCRTYTKNIGLVDQVTDAYALLDAARAVWEAQARLAQHVKDYHEQDYRRLGNECQAANLLESAFATALENWRKAK
jgi:hypothetical protein